MNKITLVLLCLCASISSFAQHVVINEYMAKNESVLQDFEGDFPDWIELYNGSSTPVDLEGFFLSDDDDEPFKWEFPSVEIEPQGFLLVFASKKDIVTDGEIHCNFKISSDGEELYLFNSEGELWDTTTEIELDENESYGRVPDGSAEFEIIQGGTPLASNEKFSSVLFSAPGGFYDESFDLTLHTAHGVDIYYTLDGSIPDNESHVYDGPISLEGLHREPNKLALIPTTPRQQEISYHAWKEPDGPVEKAHVIRCIAYRDGEPVSPLYQEVYFVGVPRYTYPVVSVLCDEDALFDEHTGIYVPGKHYDPANANWTGNYFQRGDEWEREVQISYFNAQGELVLNQACGMRIHGGKTRHAAQKSLKFYARDAYGASTFDYPLFHQKEQDSYKRFILRSTMGSWRGQSIIQDVLAREIVRDLDLDAQDFQPVILFINGEYWGIQTMRDKLDEHYLAAKYDLDKDSVDILGGTGDEVLSGSNDGFLELMDFVETHDLAVWENYVHVESQIDVSNFIDYFITQLFLTNYDWPINNIKVWRPQRPDGKWRWLLYDQDAAFGPVNLDMLAHATANDPTVPWPNPPKSTLLFRSMLEQEVFRGEFVERFQDLLNTIFRPSHTLEKLDELQALYEVELEQHISRWHYPESLTSWENDLYVHLLMFLMDRPCAVKNHIEEFFDLDSFSFDCTLQAEESTGRFELDVWPNPSSGHVNVRSPRSFGVSERIEVFNFQGEKVLQINSPQFNMDGIMALDLSHLAKGVYLLRWESKGAVSTQKVVLQP